MVRTSDCQQREPWFESSFCCFEVGAISLDKRCLNCTKKYTTIDNGAVIVARLNVSQRRRVGAEMNMF